MEQRPEQEPERAEEWQDTELTPEREAQLSSLAFVVFLILVGIVISAFLGFSYDAFMVSALMGIAYRLTLY